MIAPLRTVPPALALALAVMLAPPARADEAPPPEALAASVAGAVEGMILPGYRAFEAAATAEAEALAALCKKPGATPLWRARRGFKRLAAAFSRIEPFRFGPARRDNRFERLFFWPDRRGRGFRQVTEIIRVQDESARASDSLADKSVAVQGLPALDYALFGRESEQLRTDAPAAAFRCAYAQALGGRIAAVAAALARDWAEGYGRLVEAPGPDNPVYRSHGEVMQALLRSAREQLQVAADFKLARVIGDADRPPQPATAPFPQAGVGLRTTDANIAAIQDLLAAMNLPALMGAESAGIPDELAFHLAGARTALRDAIDLAGDQWPAVLANAEARSRAGYAVLALGYAIEILGERLPQALGLVAGFNSLDGD